jgi:hypothetical protein
VRRVSEAGRRIDDVEQREFVTCTPNDGLKGKRADHIAREGEGS